MFSSYPTTLVSNRRAQTPPASSLPTSPSDDVGRRQSLTSPDSQPTRTQNRAGTCEFMRVQGSQGKAFTRPWMLKNDGAQLKQFFSCFFVFSSIRPQQQTVHIPPASCHCCATAGDGFFSAPDHQSSGSYRSILLKIFHCETNRVTAK